MQNPLMGLELTFNALSNRSANLHEILYDGMTQASRDYGMIQAQSLYL